MLSFLVVGAAYAYTISYKNKVYPGVAVGDYSLGGMTRAEVRDFIERFNDRVASEGLSYYLNDSGGQRANINVAVVADDGYSVDLAQLGSEALSGEALRAGREGSWWKRFTNPLRFRFGSPYRLNANVRLETQLAERLRQASAAFEDAPRNAGLSVASVDPPQYSIIPERPGIVIEYDAVVDRTRAHLAVLDFSPIEITRRSFEPTVTAANVSDIAPRLLKVFEYGDLQLSYVDASGVRRDWNVSSSLYANWLEARKEAEQFVFALNEQKVKEFLNQVKGELDTQPQDARFAVENDRVKEFIASRSGISVNIDKTYQDLDAIFRERNYNPGEVNRTVSIAVDVVEPTIKMGDANELGIIEVLGVGTSTFRDSHTNRIKNIANAVRRLNGVLIKPGEDFSTNKFAGSYTSQNGFLPEMVIKGDRIIPEIGGGMCQIGTTLFRMAMNAGMPITQRQNHSLVVSYYADPANGNPGTDATVYEPSVDFKFNNDTGNYILIQTKIDYKKQMLTFTMWGKSDGRQGWYSHPTVDRWIPAGKPKEITTDSLRPGQRKCQNAFRGAVARFTYTRVTPQGERIEREFVSRYRPLPRICMVGAEPTPTTPPERATSIELPAVIETPLASST